MVFVGISCLNIAINRDHSFRSPCVMLIPVRWINNAVFCFPVWHSAVMLLVEAANFNMSSYYCLSLYRHHSLLMPFYAYEFLRLFPKQRPSPCPGLPPVLAWCDILVEPEQFYSFVFLCSKGESLLQQVDLLSGLILICKLPKNRGWNPPKSSIKK